MFNIRNVINPFSAHDALKHYFTSLKKTLNFPTTKGFGTKMSMKLVYQYMGIFFTFSPSSNHLHPLQVENCDSNSRLVVDEDDNAKIQASKGYGHFFGPWVRDISVTGMLKNVDFPR